MKTFDIALVVISLLIVVGLVFVTFEAYTQKDGNNLNTLILTDTEVKHLQKIFECVEACRCNSGHLDFKTYMRIKRKVELLEVQE